MEFIDFFLFHCRMQPEQAAIVLGAGDNISWRQLGIGIIAAQETLVRNKVSADDLVSLETPNPFHRVILFCALARSGICTINSGAEVSQFATNLNPKVFLCGGEGLPPGVAMPEGARLLTVQDDWFLPASSGQADSGSTRFEPGLPAVLLFSSGTTGEPEAMAKSAANWTAWVSTVMEQMQPTPCSRVLVIPDLISGFGMAAALATLWLGRTLFLIKAAQAAKAIELYAIEYVVATPYILAALTDAAKRHRLSMQSVRGIRLAGASAGESLLREASALFTSNICFAYSATEGGIVANAPFPVTGREPGFAGKVLPRLELRIAGDDGEDVAPGDIGEILIRGPLTSLPFTKKDTSVDPGHDYWARPGDLGRFDADGNLVVTGRVSDIINIGGAKVRPEAIEEFLAGEPGVREAGVVGIFPQTGRIEEVHIFVAGDNLDADELKRRWHDTLGIARPHRVHLIPELPRNRLGKIARAELRTLARHA